jgi:SAM-dependent methyltransferase
VSFWLSPLADKYARQSVATPAGIDAHWLPLLGQSRVGIDRQMLAGVRRDARVLEVGCGAGNQIGALAELGFTDLSGCDINPEAVAIARRRFPTADIAEATACALPYKAGAFDLVYTSALLIHIPPAVLPCVLDELVRVSARWVYGYEYYNSKPISRASTLGGLAPDGIPGLTHKAPFRDLLLERHPKLKPVRSVTVRHADGSGNLDMAYLLEK